MCPAADWWPESRSHRRGQWYDAPRQFGATAGSLRCWRRSVALRRASAAWPPIADPRFVFLGKLLPVVVAHGTMHGGVHVAGTMLPNSRTTLWTSITGKSGAPRYSSRTQKTHQRRSRDEGGDNLLPRQTSSHSSRNPRGGEAGARHAQSHCGERLFSPHPLWCLGHQATRYAGSASRRGPLSRGVRARLAIRTSVDGLRVRVGAAHATLGTLAWISTGRVRAGVDSPHLCGRWDCDAESDAGWHGVKARARARHRAGDGSHYPPPVPVGGSALGA